MSLQEAVEAPRVWTQGQALEMEEGISPDVRGGLAAMGHDVQVVPKVAGGLNGVMLNQAPDLIHGRGMLEGGRHACRLSPNPPKV